MDEFPSRNGLRRRQRPLAGALALITAFSLVASAAHAAALYRQELINDDQTGEEDRMDPAMLPLSSGGFLLFWIDASRGQTDVFSRAFHSDLTPAGDPLLVNTDGVYQPQSTVILAAPGGGRAAAVWQSGSAGHTNLDAQIYSSVDGSLVGANVPLTDDPYSTPQSLAAAATDSAGLSLICWVDRRTGHNQIWGQRLDASGSRVGTNRSLVPEYGTLDQENPALGSLPGGRWLLAWDQPLGAVRHLYYRVLQADGTSTDGPHAADGDSTIDQEDPAVLVRAQDALLVWRDDRQYVGDLWGQWFALGGVPDGSGARMRVSTDPAVGSDPRIFGAADGSFALVWFGTVADRQRAMVRPFGPDRSPLSAEAPMNDPPSRSITVREGVAGHPPDAAGWIISWSDDWALTDQVYLDTLDPASGPSGARNQALRVPGSGSQIFGDVALLPDGRTVVAWGDTRDGNYNIRARILDSGGSPDSLHPSFLVNDTPINRRLLETDGLGTMFAYSPRVAASGIGTFVITWGIDASGGSMSYFAQLFDPQGQPIGNNFPVLPDPNLASGQFDARPAMGLDGRFAIAVRTPSGGGHGTGGADILVQRYSPVGDTLGTIIQVEDPTKSVFNRVSPSIAMDPFYEMMVAWSDFRSGGWDIFRERLSPSGHREDPSDVQLNLPDDSGSDQDFPSIATNGSLIVTVWDDTPALSGMIKGRLEALQSAPHAPGARPASVQGSYVDFVVNATNHPTGFKYPRVAMSSTGSFVVTWWDMSHGNTELWAQRFDGNANLIGAPYLLNDSDHIDAGMFPAAAAAADTIEYVWTDSRRWRGWDIFGRRVTWEFDGQVPVELNSWSAISIAGGIELRWSIPLGTQFSGFRVWRDHQGAEGGSVPSAGARLLSNWIAPQSGSTYTFDDHTAPAGVPVAFFVEAKELDGTSHFFGPFNTVWAAPTAWRIAPNPFRDQVEFVPPALGQARLTVWDTAGRKVWSVERPEASAVPLLWDGRDMRGRPVATGVYFARLYPGSEGKSSQLVKLLRIR